jgi:hypothetical protein
MRRFQISSVRNLNFGVHHEMTLNELAHDFVCVYGVNESGKTTLAEFLQWSIGGPAGDASNALRFLSTGDSEIVNGQLRAQIDGNDFDVEAKFRVLRRGTPNDLRKANYLGRDLDAAAIAKDLGDVVPDDYGLINRLRGTELGMGGEADSFSNLFTSIAIGSTSSSTNPREALKQLGARSNSLSTDINKLKKSRKDLEAEVRRVKTRPDELAGLERELQEQEAKGEGLREKIAAIARQKGLLERAKEIRPKDEALRMAEATLKRLGPMSDSWRDVARSATVFQAAHDAVSDQEAAIATLTGRFEDERSKLGLPASAFDNQTFSLLDRNRLQDAKVETARCETNLSDAIHSHSEIQQAIDALAPRIDHDASEIGIDSSTFPRLVGNESAIRELIGSATLWSRSESVVSGATSTQAGLQSRLATLTGTPTSRFPAKNGRSKTATRVVTALITALFIGGLVAAVLNVYASIALLALAVLVAVLNPRTAGKEGDSDADYAQVRKEFAEATGKLEEQRTEATREREKFTDGLAHFGIAIPADPSNAENFVKRLADLSKLVTEMTSKRESLDSEEDRISSMQKLAEDAASDLQRLLLDRHVQFVPPSEFFDDWLIGYEAASHASIQLRQKEAALVGLVAQRDQFVEPVRPDLEALSPDQILAKIRGKETLLIEIEQAEKEQKDAVIPIDALGDLRDEVMGLLESHIDLESLESESQYLENQSKGLDAERVAAIMHCTNLEREVDELLQSEKLADLLGEQSGIDEDLLDLEMQLDVVDRSKSILSRVIDKYESDNQDPLIKQAQRLIEEVVPGWGSLLFRRDESGKVLIERRDDVARLEDSKLSYGARALLYLALRIAFVRSDGDRRGIALPILCDDPLVHLDDDRRDGALKLLAATSATHQVILFTCDQRTRDQAGVAGANIVNLVKT